MKKKLAVLAAVLMASAVLGGCAQKAPETETQTQTQTETQTETETETVATEAGTFDQGEALPKGKVRSYLTGKIVDKKIGRKRPYAIMLNNIYGAIPQAGIERADVVYEAPVEGAITRLMGIFEDYYMRGRTLDNAFIILDEAQNTTPAQMKMFLTRIGFGSKVIITGDKTQKDLPSSAASGLDVAMKVLKKVDGISFCELTSKDVVRHPLVQKIVQAYEEYEKKAVQKKTDRTVKSKTKTSTGTTRRKS